LRGGNIGAESQTPISLFSTKEIISRQDKNLDIAKYVKPKFDESTAAKITKGSEDISGW
jgi:hypothetical protein